MGSTVSVSKKVTAKLIGGEKFYWLFESTYEKNCYPHTPHEGCIGFGRIDKILERIFLFGSNCEGGMLQTPSGHITPESYIRRWLDLLENPMEMNVSPEPISVGAYGRAIREENLDDAVKILARNWTDGAECLKTLKKASVDWNELDQMLALEALCNSKNVFVWRIFDNSGAGLTNSELGYRFEKTGNHEIEPVVGWRVDSEEIVLKTGEFMRKAGWSYSIVGRFIQNEPSQPGFNPIDSLSRINPSPRESPRFRCRLRRTK
ncbi:MAG: hypothetical protein JVY19_01325 [Ferrovum myxofaciens]|uniref:hypothetical protein n=1 Tax=Ferrovum myxofaciens TaxID=416213 RepID=UPI001C7882BC|nr:hypothetical protein [Ferrovum myxofaciens]QWY75119.1 MAG: hypothetical protein JVY19_01325 [Ferrovum myxofaciens]